METTAQPNQPVIHCRYDRLVPVGELRPYPKNRNEHSPEQIARLALLLRYQGIRAPIVVASDPYCWIAKGHGTLEAIKFNGWTHAPVVDQHFESEEQLYAYVQSDNAIAEWARLNIEGINADLPDLGPDFDIDMLGIKDFVLEPAEKDEPAPLDLSEQLLVVVECQTEIEQREIFEELVGRGLKCKVMS